jgi:hypothetical protein
VSQTLDMLFGVTGQSLYYDAPEGRPFSITSSTVYENSTGDDGTAETATTGAAAVETNLSTTFDADSGVGQADARICNVTATTSAKIGQTYIATNALGERDMVEIIAISSGAFVVGREPLQNAYANGDAFVSTRITHALDSTWVAASTNISGDFDPNPRYRWRLVYVVASVTYVADVYFDLLRYAGRHDVSPVDVDRRAPGWMNRAAHNHREDQGRALIDEACRVVKFDLYNLSTPDQSVRNREAMNELVTLKAIELVDTNELTTRRYDERLAQLIANAKVVVSKDSTGAASPADMRPIWRR